MATSPPSRQLTMPTPRTFLRLANDNIMNNLRRRRDANLALPSLYKLAYAVVYNTGEIPVELGNTPNPEAQ
jgi:hypothetical protein